jgi:hypothetical protein
MGINVLMYTQLHVRGWHFRLEVGEASLYDKARFERSVTATDESSVTMLKK